MTRRVRSAAPISYADPANRYKLDGDLRGRLSGKCSYRGKIRDNSSFRVMSILFRGSACDRAALCINILINGVDARINISQL